MFKEKTFYFNCLKKTFENKMKNDVLYLKYFYRNYKNCF